MSQLYSKAVSKTVDLVSEGEIGGLLVGAKSIYLDGTPLQDANGTDNFEGASFNDDSKGTNTQSYLPGYPGVESTVSVNLKVKKGSPGAIQKTITDSTLDAIRVAVFFPVLSRQDDDKLVGTSVAFKIYLKKDGGSFGTTEGLDMFSNTISGKATQRFEKSFRIEIPSTWKTAGFTSITVKVERTTNDSTSDKVNDVMYWGSYTKIIDNKLRYPNSALVGMTFNAEQFSSIPTRGYEIKGIKVKVPSNYTPYDPGHCSIGGYRRKDTCEGGTGTWTGTTEGTNLYDGSWDGTFVTKWTCNPAWILYDICTKERYGLGKWLEAAQLDKWALYEIAKYCDAVDDDGEFVGVASGWSDSNSDPIKEARFTCHLYLQTKQEAFKVLNDIAAVFRGLIYWQEGLVTPVQDAPKDALMNFSEANVIGGLFTYEGSSKKVRHNVALVTWNNPEELYKKNVEYVEDEEGIALANYQIVSKSLTALGCTSQSQARRIGKWLLYSEKFETEICTFKTGMEATGLRPGNIIKVADPTRSSRRYGGRVSSGSTVSSVNLDNAVSIDSSKTYKLALVNTEAACVRVSCSNSAYTTQEDCEANNAIWAAVKQSETTQETCLNAHVDNEWKPYTWVEQKIVTNEATGIQDFTRLTFITSQKFTNLPTSTHMWILEEIGTVEAQEFRVLAVRESEPNIYDVSSLKYHSGKFTSIEDNIEFSAKSISSLPDPASEVPTPTFLEVHEELYLDSRGTVKNRATFSWQAPAAYPYTAGYYAEWRRSANDEWISLGETTSTSVTIDDAPAGTVQFKVKTKRIY